MMMICRMMVPDKWEGKMHKKYLERKIAVVPQSQTHNKTLLSNNPSITLCILHPLSSILIMILTTMKMSKISWNSKKTTNCKKKKKKKKDREDFQYQITSSRKWLKCFRNSNTSGRAPSSIFISKEIKQFKPAHQVYNLWMIWNGKMVIDQWKKFINEP